MPGFGLKPAESKQIEKKARLGIAKTGDQATLVSLKDTNVKGILKMG